MVQARACMGSIMKKLSGAFKKEHKQEKNSSKNQKDVGMRLLAYTKFTFRNDSVTGCQSA